MIFWSLTCKIHACGELNARGQNSMIEIWIRKTKAKMYMTVAKEFGYFSWSQIRLPNSKLNAKKEINPRRTKTVCIP
jgi:hypothetical protein